MEPPHPLKGCLPNQSQPQWCHRQEDLSNQQEHFDSVMIDEVKAWKDELSHWKWMFTCELTTQCGQKPMSFLKDGL